MTYIYITNTRTIKDVHYTWTLNFCWKCKEKYFAITAICVLYYVLHIRILTRFHICVKNVMRLAKNGLAGWFHCSKVKTLSCKMLICLHYCKKFHYYWLKVTFMTKIKIASISKNQYCRFCATFANWCSKSGAKEG